MRHLVLHRPLLRRAVTVLLAAMTAAGVVSIAGAGAGKPVVYPDHGNAGPPNWAGSDAILYQDENHGVARATPSTGAWVHLAGEPGNGAFVAWTNADPHGRGVAASYASPPSLVWVPVGRQTPHTIASTTGLAEFVTWKPDGTSIAFAANEAVYTVDFPTGVPHLVAGAETNVINWIRAYRSDGSLVVLHGPNTANNFELRRYPAAGGPATLASGVAEAAVSPDGTTAVYTTADGSLWSVPVDGGTPISLGLDEVSPYGVGFAFAPDGSRVAVTTTTGYPDYTPISFLVDVDGSEPVKTQPATLSWFDWSPDGTRLLAQRGDELVTLDPGGGNVVVVSRRSCIEAAWSPDSHKIACLVTGNQLDVHPMASLSLSAGPAVKSFSPAAGPAGTVVTLKGSLSGVTSVRFSGIEASFTVAPGGKSMTATVPVGAITDAVTVSSPAGATSSRTEFPVTNEIDVGDCLTAGDVDVTAGQSPRFSTIWHLSSRASLKVFAKSTTTTLSIDGVAVRKPAFDKKGTADGGGWQTSFTYLAPALRSVGDSSTITFHVVVSKAFSDGATSYTPGQELYPGPTCTVHAT